MARRGAHARTPGPKLSDLASGVRMAGPVGEIRLHGQLAGLLYRWELVGRAVDWEVKAERYKLDPLFFRNGAREGEIKVVLDKRPVRFTGTGTIWTEPTVDGHTHRAIVIRGRNMQCREAPAAPADAKTAAKTA